MSKTRSYLHDSHVDPNLTPAEVQPALVGLSYLLANFVASRTTGYTVSIDAEGYLLVEWDGVPVTTDWSSTLQTAMTLINPVPLRTAAQTTPLRSIGQVLCELEEADAVGIAVGVGLFNAPSNPTDGVVMFLRKDGAGTAELVGPQGERTNLSNGSFPFRGGLVLNATSQAAGSCAWDGGQYNLTTGLILDTERGSRGGAISDLGGSFDWYPGLVFPAVQAAPASQRVLKYGSHGLLVQRLGGS